MAKEKIVTDWNDPILKTFIIKMIIVAVVVVFVVFYLFVGTPPCEKERLRQLKEYPAISIKNELHGYVDEVRKDFCFRVGENFWGTIGHEKHHIFFEPTPMDFHGLIVGDSISKQADTNLITVYRGQTVFKLRIQEE